MKKLFCSFLFLCICVNAFSQEDKLISKIKKYTKPDSIRVEMLVDACVKGTFTSDSVLLQYATEAYTISEKIN